MADLRRRMNEDRTLRDAARGLVEADIANLRAGLASKTISERILGRVGESASDLLDHAGETAQNNRGILAALIGAITLWFARNPIMSLFNDEDETDLGEQTTANNQTGATDGE